MFRVFLAIAVAFVIASGAARAAPITVRFYDQSGARVGSGWYSNNFGTTPATSLCRYQDAPEDWCAHWGDLILLGSAHFEIYDQVFGEPTEGFALGGPYPGNTFHINHRYMDAGIYHFWLWGGGANLQMSTDGGWFMPLAGYSGTYEVGSVPAPAAFLLFLAGLPLLVRMRKRA